jgi:hypothetical protein
MADSPAFEAVCDALETSSSLDRLEARGTVRLALKQAGLEARSVSAAQLAVVVEKVLPEELDSRGVAVGMVAQLLQSLTGLSHDDLGGAENPEDVFTRLGN